MFKKLKKIWKKNTLDTIKKQTHDMLIMEEDMFKDSMTSVFGKENKTKKVQLMDRKINKYEKDMREKILTHLTINPREDLTSFLLMLEVARQIERIGDYCKNICDLRDLYGKRVDNGKYLKEIIEAKDKITESFEILIRSYERNNKADARKVMDIHKKIINPKLKKIKTNIVKEPKMNAKKAVVFSLIARYLRRISAHQANVASAIINPFLKTYDFR